MSGWSSTTCTPDLATRDEYCQIWYSNSRPWHRQRLTSKRRSGCERPEFEQRQRTGGRWSTRDGCFRRAAVTGMQSPRRRRRHLASASSPWSQTTSGSAPSFAQSCSASILLIAEGWSSWRENPSVFLLAPAKFRSVRGPLDGGRVVELERSPRSSRTCQI